MKTFKLSVKKRTDLGKKGTQALRKSENVPCVMYGGEEVVHFYAPENDFSKLIYTNDVLLVEIDVEGTAYKAVIQDIQFHPVTDKILHIDFVQVFDDKPTVVSLPIKLTGNSKGIIAGGKLRLKKRYLKVKGLASDLPEVLVIDITNLKIGGVIKVSDLKYDNIELLDASQAMVVGIVTSRLAKSGGADMDEEEESSEEGEAAAEDSEA